MIFQLVKRDPLWKALFFLIPAAIFRGLIFGQSRDEFVIAFSGPVFIFAASFIPQLQMASTSYLSPLPVTVREVFAARVLAMVALFWLTVAAASPWIHTIAPLELTSFATLVVLAMQSFSILKRKASVWAYFVFIPLLTAGTFVRIGAPEWLEGWRGAVVTLVTLGAAGCIYSWRWYTLPPSFEMAPGKPNAPGRKTVAAGRTQSSLLGGLLTIYPWQYFVWVVALFVQTATSGILGGAFMAFALLGLQHTGRWIMALPISRSRILALWIFPAIVSSIAGLRAYTFFRGPFAGIEGLWPSLLSGLLLLLGVMSFATAAVLTTAWYRFRRLPPWLRWAPSAIAFAFWLAALTHPQPVADSVVHLTRILPRLWLPALTVPVVFLYLAANKLFREAEFTGEQKRALL